MFYKIISKIQSYKTLQSKSTTHSSIKVDYYMITNKLRISIYTSMTTFYEPKL